MYTLEDAYEDGIIKLMHSNAETTMYLPRLAEPLLCYAEIVRGSRGLTSGDQSQVGFFCSLKRLRCISHLQYDAMSAALKSNIASQ